MSTKFFLFTCFFISFIEMNAQQKAKPEDTEVYSPVPKTVDPGKPGCTAPSDAIVLFDGTNLN